MRVSRRKMCGNNQMEKTHNSPSIACFREKDETKDPCVRENKSEREKEGEREMIHGVSNPSS